MENHFIPLQSLAQQLTDQLNHLYSGQYKKESLESMVSNARDLYERLVVLRHKAYEQEVNIISAEEKPNADIEVQIPTFTLDLSEISETKIDVSVEEEVIPAQIESMTDQRQVNLMDMIEEVTKTDHSSDVELSETFLAETPTEISSDPIQLETTPIVSLNDILSQNQNTSTLLNRLEKSKIDDLKKSITMNQRFQFARELFNGDSEQYEITISALNNCEPEKALEIFQNCKQKWAWDETSIAFIELLDLVQRRHEI
jgi:hypothetical protein